MLYRYFTVWSNYKSLSTYNPGISVQSWFMGKEANGRGGAGDLLCSCTGMLATLATLS